MQFLEGGGAFAPNAPSWIRHCIVYLYASEVKDDESITQMKEHAGGQCSISVLVNPASVFTILLLNSSPFQLFCFTCVFPNI